MLTIKVLGGTVLSALGLTPGAVAVQHFAERWPIVALIVFLAAIAGDVGILLVYAELVR